MFEINFNQIKSNMSMDPIQLHDEVLCSVGLTESKLHLPPPPEAGSPRRWWRFWAWLRRTALPRWVSVLLNKQDRFSTWSVVSS